MENINSPITDDQLRQRLLSSYIDQNQKEELSEMISDMTEDERSQLLNLIQESQIAFEQAQAQQAEDPEIAEINERYQKKIDELMKSNIKEAYEESEKLEDSEEKSELKEMEGEISTIEISQSGSQDSKDLTQQSRQEIVRKSHPVIKFFFILIVLIMVIAGIYIGMTVL